jgi:hypothetical protein
MNIIGEEFSSVCGAALCCLADSINNNRILSYRVIADQIYMAGSLGYWKLSVFG